MGTGTGCPRCGATATVGVLCGECAASIVPGETMIREHVTSRLGRDEGAGWLIDGFGAAHPIGPTRTLVGRRPQADLVILNGSVSREHAELHCIGGEWQIRDLGSRNRTQLDGRRIEGRAPLPDRSVIRFGDVAFLFIGRPVALGGVEATSVPTTHAVGNGAFRFTLRGPSVDLCLLGGAGGGDDASAGGALLYRDPSSSNWSETSLPPLEFHLLRALCVRAVEEAESPSRSRGCVATKQLARLLPFQSRYANEENVRQVVRRVRTTLDKIGAEGLVEALPGRGYYVTWPVVVP